MIAKLKQQVEQRFESLEKIEIFAEATILDCRFKKFRFFRRYSFAEEKQKIEKATSVLVKNDT